MLTKPITKHKAIKHPTRRRALRFRGIWKAVVAPKKSPIFPARSPLWKAYALKFIGDWPSAKKAGRAGILQFPKVFYLLSLTGGQRACIMHTWKWHAPTSKHWRPCALISLLKTTSPKINASALSIPSLMCANAQTLSLTLIASLSGFKISCKETKKK